MPAFFIPSASISNGTVTITGELLHHLRASLRVKPGDTLRFTDQRPARHITLVRHVGTNRIVADIQTTLPAPTPRLPSFELALAILKGDHMAWGLQKAVELGASSVVPLLTARGTVRPPANRIQSIQQRWQRIALEAAQQSEQWHMPTVQLITEAGSYFRQPRCGATALLLVERSEGAELGSIPLPHDASQALVIAVGPEGGWTPDEVACAVQQQFIATSLGRTILRSETAAVASLAILQHRLGGLAS